MIFLKQTLIGANVFAGTGVLVYYLGNELVKSYLEENTIGAYLIKNNFVPLSTQTSPNSKEDLDHWTYLKVHHKNDEIAKVNSIVPKLKDGEVIDFFKKECEKLLKSQIPRDKESSSKYIKASKWCVRPKTLFDKLISKGKKIPRFSHEDTFWNDNNYDNKTKELIKSTFQLIHQDFSKEDTINRWQICLSLLDQRTLEDNFNKYLQLANKLCVKN